MIFVTVGEQLPFDRLIRGMEKYAILSNFTVFAQIGNSSLIPKNLEYAKFLSQAEFKRRIEESQIIVAHAGMGTIISVLELNKPIIVFPRQASLGEHRNDHQLATAKRFASSHRIAVAYDEKELLEKLMKPDDLRAEQQDRNAVSASENLLHTIREFIRD